MLKSLIHSKIHFIYKDSAGLAVFTGASVHFTLLLHSEIACH